MTVKKPEPMNDLGFLAYGGNEPMQTSDGHEIRVLESSEDSGPHVYMCIRTGYTGYGNVHLSLDEVIELRERLEQFIEYVPARWTNGKKLLERAQQRVLGKATYIRDLKRSWFGFRGKVLQEVMEKFQKAGDGSMADAVKIVVAMQEERKQ